MRHLLAATVFLAAGSPVFPQNFDPPPARTPDAATLKQIEERTAVLKAAVVAAVKDLPEVHRGDLEVYVKAAEWIVRHQEWYTADSGKQTLAVIEQGIKRVESARGGKTPWLEPKGRSVARGYRSRIDNSVQPYGVVYPVGYGADPKKKWRLDISLHGRDSSLTEVKHLNQHNGKEAPKDQDFVQINIYGRGNNAYRWAGETDVFEAMEHFLAAEKAAERKDSIDLRRVVLKGFSMGGAGTWHLGLRHPDRFAVIQPGAGFTTTHRYIAKLPDPLPDYQEKCLTIYDAYRYAENAFDVPIVAYSGEIDKQRQAAENIQAELKKLGLSDRMTHLIGPGLEHKFPPEWQRAAEAELKKYAGGGKGRPAFPSHVKFVTYTAKNATCEWLRIRELEREYEQAVIDATWIDGSLKITTKNVRRVDLRDPPDESFPGELTVDGQKVKGAVSSEPEKKESGPDRSYRLEKVDGKWRRRTIVDEGPPDQIPLFPPSKSAGLQGPIDDAFTGRFVCVVGTGKPYHASTQRAAEAQLDRFRREWDKYMRGNLRVVTDSEVTEKELSDSSLILFGDPESNLIIARLLRRSGPLKWTESELEFCGKRYDPSTHLPMMIYPNPLGKGYVVLNSGHTFHAADFQGTNALLYARLGDYAIVKPTPTAKDPAAFDVVTAGLFDEHWGVPKK
jgi:predicted esterase